MEVQTHLAAVPEVKKSEVLFGDQLAVRLECAREAVDAAAGRLGLIEGVRAAKLYTGDGSREITPPQRRTRQAPAPS